MTSIVKNVIIVETANKFVNAKLKKLIIIVIISMYMNPI